MKNVICCLLLFAGCSWSTQPQYRLNTEGRDSKTINRDQTEAISGVLVKLFGTPDSPVVPDGIDLNVDLLKMASGPIGSDENDCQRGLYRKHCVACHGLSGDGSGANAADLDPYPCDFRNGVFKYTSTAANAKPLCEDLLRTLRNGNPGTSMPSFSKLPDEQIQSLVEYVKYLCIRGETELYLFQRVVDENAKLPLDTAEVLQKGVAPAAKSWSETEKYAFVPPDPPKIDTLEQLSVSIDRGRVLFRTMGGQCFSCHGWTGQGNGDRTGLYDDWNKRKKGETPEKTKKLTQCFQLPIQALRVRNLTEGAFRGGDRPIDIYWRIAVGIKGTPMPAAGPAPGRNGALSAEDIWHVVNYVRSLGEKDSRLSAQDLVHK